MTETNRIEFKRELTRELDIEREVVAFLNYHEGGMLYIGIDDSGKPIGVQDIDGDMLKIKDRIRNGISPSPMGLFDVMVERIDDYYMQQFAHVEVSPDAKINTETPAWAIDRLSILALKIYHFGIEVARTDVDAAHHERCLNKYNTLLEQKADLMQAIDDLLHELATGRKRMKLYRQMKMYNDPSLNPMLYNKK